ncbi:MAG: helix-turn-helix domain-containing protein [Actinomycetota bacterium]
MAHRTGGRKPKLAPQQVKLARQLYDAREHTVEQIAAMLGVTRTTIYRHLETGLEPRPAPAGKK